ILYRRHEVSCPKQDMFEHVTAVVAAFQELWECRQCNRQWARLTDL
ncbi:hypothetical protein scyTo_0026153, partial [Scyliorhinus torazame]|nr:hypothetical protein [Scyliorhinus torazame]